VLRLFGVQRDPKAPEARSESSGASIALGQVHEELLEALSVDGESLEAAMADLAEQQPLLGKQLQREHWDQVRLVDRIFDAMDQLERLPDALRQLLNQLRLPVLQLVLNDPDFLDDASHPGRGLLNNLMQLCVADRGSSNHLRKTVDRVIHQLTEQPVPDHDALESLNTQIAQLVERQRQAFLRNADRIAKTHEGRQQLDRARRAIQRRINARLAGREVPMVLLDLLGAGWEQIMVLALLREGADSQAVAELFSVIVQIQRWLGPDDDSDEAAFERELETPALLDLIERHMMTTGELARHRAVLKRLGAQLREEEQPDYVWLASHPLGEEPATPESRSAANDSRWYDRARELAMGDWVALEDEAGGVRRMRLVWVGTMPTSSCSSPRKGSMRWSMTLIRSSNTWPTDRCSRWRRTRFPLWIRRSTTSSRISTGRWRSVPPTIPLTGCLSRHEFEKHLTRLCQQASASGDTGVLILVDIDQFSVINASYGTGAGDAVLRELGTLLSDSATNGDASEARVGRLGSNEFAVAVTPPLPIEEGLDRSEAVRRRVREHTFHSQGASFGATVSVGVADIGGDILDASGLL